MTNRLALILGAIVVLALILDNAVLHTGATLFLVRKVADLATWIAFWR